MLPAGAGPLAGVPIASLLLLGYPVPCMTLTPQSSAPGCGRTPAVTVRGPWDVLRRAELDVLLVHVCEMQVGWAGSTAGSSSSSTQCLVAWCSAVGPTR